MLDEKGGGDHANAIMHIAGMPKLAHAGVDDRIAGLSVAPSIESFFVVEIRETIETGVPVLFCEVGKVVEKRVRKLSPRQFAEVSLTGGGRRAISERVLDRGGDATRRDFAKTQVRREA